MWGEPDLGDDALKWMFSEFVAISTKLFNRLQRIV